MRIVAVVSGGLDSVVMLHDAAAHGVDVAEVVSFDYGQRNHRELRYAETAAEKVGASWRVIELRRVFDGGSVLTDPLTGLPYTADASDAAQRVTVVPGRNAVLLAVAAARAGAVGAGLVGFGAQGNNPIYRDDNTPFIHAMSAVLEETYGVGVWAPYTDATKADVVKVGEALGVDLAETWSCYDDGPIHCGRCGACVARRAAFTRAAVDDPTIYDDGGMLPTASEFRT